MTEQFEVAVSGVTAGSAGATAEHSGRRATTDTAVGGATPAGKA